jgi:hypothetical protein
MESNPELAGLVWEAVQHHVKHVWHLLPKTPDSEDGLLLEIQCPFCGWIAEAPVSYGMRTPEKAIVRDKLRRHMRSKHTLGDVQGYLLERVMAGD